MIYLTNINLSQNELQNAVVQPLATPPTTPKLGQIYTDSVSSKIKWFDGTNWKTIGVVVESSATNGNILIDGVEMSVYTLPIASANQIGGVKIGSGLSIDANGLLSATQGGLADSVEWSGVLHKPTALSDFTNDENFIDNTVENLVNYYKKSETYTKIEVNSLIGNIATIQISPVDSLPATGETNVIYLIPKDPAQSSNAKDEYLWTGSAFEKIGDTSIDLTNYLQKNGEGSDVVVGFTPSGTRSLPATGESLAIIIGKVVRYLSDLKSVAYSGAYEDLSGKPNLVKYASFTLATTENTKSQHFDGSSIYSVLVTDTVTHDAVICDIDITGTDITVSVSSNPTNDLEISVLYV